MPTFAIINNGVVENCVVAESSSDITLPTGSICVEYTAEDLVGIGFLYSDGAFTNPNPTVVSYPEEPTEE
jgi:hypothetical protein